MSIYYQSQFPALWERVNAFVKSEKILSVKEVLNELYAFRGETELITWTKQNKILFQPMNEKEGQIISHIFQKYPKFQDMISKQKILKGRPVADPFVVAKALEVKGAVVSEESFKENRMDIPNLCHIMNVQCVKLKDFMQKEDLKF